VYGDPWQATMYQNFYNAPQRSITFQQWYRGILAGEVSFWATFGWLNILAPEWVYTFYKVLLRIGLVGMLVYFFRKMLRLDVRLPTQKRGARIQTGANDTQALLYPISIGVTTFLISSPLISSLILSRLLATETGIQGRQLLPMLPALSLLLVIGYRALFPRLFFRPLLFGLGVVMVGITLYLPYFVIAPAYAKPLSLTELDLPSEMISLSRQYNDTIELLGYTVDSETVQLGQLNTITLYWRKTTPLDQDYTVFIHALGRNLAKIGEYNGYPGMGNLSTSAWPVGQVIADRYTIQIDSQANAPTLLRLHVGFFDHTRLDLPPLTTTDLASNVVTPLIAEQTLLPRKDETVMSDNDCVRLAVHFADHISLTCYKLHTDASRVSLDLHWATEDVPSEDYTVFIQLWQRNQQIAGFDGPPFTGDFPTSYWQPDYPFVDEHVFDVSALESGAYRVLVGLYNAQTGGRLSAVDGRGAALQDFAVDLGEVVISE
ncbi:MAG: hypothetical protein AAF485_31975, partial [Chloroflexota bacterium]